MSEPAGRGSLAQDASLTPGRDAYPAASRTPVLGIDVSRFQGTIDWDQVAAARILNPVTRKHEKIRFAIIRSSGAGWVDASFERNWKEAKRVGIVRGPYVAMTAAAYQHGARAYFDSLKLALGGDYSAFDLPPFLDHEKGQADTPTPAQSRLNVAVVVGVRDLIAREMGRACGVYTGAYWQWNVPRDMQDKLSGSPLFVPDYGPVNGFPWSARIPDGWNKWYIRQYTSTQRVPGITANTVDMDLYDGGLASLQLFIIRSHITAIPWWGYVSALLVLLSVVGFAYLKG